LFAYHHTRRHGRAARRTAGINVLKRWLGPAGTPYLGDVEKARYRKKTYTKEKWKEVKGRTSEL